MVFEIICSAPNLGVAFPFLPIRAPKDKLHRQPLGNTYTLPEHGFVVRGSRRVFLSRVCVAGVFCPRFPFLHPVAFSIFCVFNALPAVDIAFPKKMHDARPNSEKPFHQPPPLPRFCRTYSRCRKNSFRGLSSRPGLSDRRGENRPC